MAPWLAGRPSVPVRCEPSQSHSRALEKEEGSEQEQERSAGAFYESPVGAFVRFLKSNHRPTSSRRRVWFDQRTPDGHSGQYKVSSSDCEKRMISGPIYNEINNLEIDLCLFIVLPPVHCHSSPIGAQFRRRREATQ